MPSPEAMELDKDLEEAGCHHGFPLWSSFDKGRGLILAKGAPMSDQVGYGADHPLFYDRAAMLERELAAMESSQAFNSWHTRDRQVVVIKDEYGSGLAFRNNRRTRLNILLNTMVVRSGVAGLEDSEARAQQLLRTKISESQWVSYLLNGMFLETSKRSGVTYVLRKGLPTIALRIQPMAIGKGEIRIFLAALCLHSLAYYEGTHAGCMPPTDDLITHLLMIRADERRYWAKATHHALDEPQSAI